MTRDRLWWVLVLLLAAAGGWWLSNNTEWVERPVPRAAIGEARDNPVYAFEQVMRKLGLQAVHHDTLDELPPPTARLVLLSDDWSLVPGRAERLHQWVKRGGHLVLLHGTGWDGKALGDWVPIGPIPVKEQNLTASKPGSPGATGIPAPSDAASASASAPAAPHHDDDDIDEDDDEFDTEITPGKKGPFLTDGTRQYRACGLFFWGERLKARSSQALSWHLTQGSGSQGMRVGMGQGSVTVINSFPKVFEGRTVLSCDHALLLATALQATPGATVWLYLNEKREPLLPWLWHSGWIAVVFGALALAAALWRGAVRFGPRLAPAPRLRRSISEQVRGLGSYLHRHGSEALLVAQQRALEETAGRCLAGYSRQPVHERARLVAEATGLTQADLSAALSARFCTRAELPQRLQVLESARRRLHRTHDERHPR